ncbi:deoxyribose-phosphate aldolase [Oscillospiraceae bacterium OttesenSCG-928-F05]|nr:deoxyribose-phosphate aldolase [Oscillospiraceae bacterium OttesenSCG-928-F05]
MTLKEILSAVDHTCLAPTASWEDIRRLCDEGLRHGVASVCIPPAFVKAAGDYLTGRLPVCTVIGFPNGYNTLAAKCFEAEDALKNGADELDMVIPIGALKAGKTAEVRQEIEALKKISGRKILKVIIETCLLTDDEKAAMCHIVAEAGADFIKTSTGFSTGGATADDIRLFRKHLPGTVAIKAAGGISSLDDAELFLGLGASRLGTSRIVALAEGRKQAGY